MSVFIVTAHKNTHYLILNRGAPGNKGIAKCVFTLNKVCMYVCIDGWMDGCNVVFQSVSLFQMPV